MAIESTLQVPARAGGASLADWAEAVVLAEGVATLSKTAIRERLGSAAAMEETELAVLFGEIRQRKSRAPNSYPFQSTSAGLRLSDDITPDLYAFLLMLSIDQAPYRAAKAWSVGSEFDLLAREALKRYLGPGSQGIVFASPPHYDRTATDFAEAIRWLADEMDLEEGSGKRSPRKKDGGVDVVAWRRFNDRSPGFLAALAQCTLRTSFVHKADDICDEQWTDWIRFGRAPIRVLAVPHALSAGDERWDDLRYRSTVVIDRLRLCSLLDPIDFTVESGYGPALEWTQGQLNDLRVVD